LSQLAALFSLRFDQPAAFKTQGVRLHEMPVNGDPISPNQPSELQSKIDAYDVTKLEDRKAISKEVLVHVSGE
jgi:spore germination protein GerM